MTSNAALSTFPSWGPAVEVGSLTYEFNRSAGETCKDAFSEALAAACEALGLTIETKTDYYSGLPASQDTAQATLSRLVSGWVSHTEGDAT